MNHIPAFLARHLFVSAIVAFVIGANVHYALTNGGQSRPTPPTTTTQPTRPTRPTRPAPTTTIPEPDPQWGIVADVLDQAWWEAEALGFTIPCYTVDLLVESLPGDEAGWASTCVIAIADDLEGWALEYAVRHELAHIITDLVPHDDPWFRDVEADLAACVGVYLTYGADPEYAEYIELGPERSCDD